MRVAIVDWDGTLFNTEQRLREATKSGKFDWNVWKNPDWMRTDVPSWVLGAIRHLKEVQGFTIVIFSGRGDSNKHVTLEMIDQWQVPYDHLFMRNDDPDGPDYKVSENHKGKYRHQSPDYEVKTRMWNEELASVGIDPHDVEVVFDDNPKVIKMWHELQEQGFNFFLHQLPFNNG